MEFHRSYTTLDTHTAGEPLRIVTAGIPLIPGATMLQKRQWVKENLDQVRRSLMLEPRGHADMYGCYLTPPVSDKADLGVIFMHNEGYSSMCGHGIIALASAAVAQGMVKTQTPETRLGIDTPAGFVEAFVAWDGRKVGGVRFTNVPSFLYQRGLQVSTASFGTLDVDIAFGGAFYAYLEAEQVGLELTPDNLRSLIQLGDEVKHATAAVSTIVHPLEPGLHSLYGTIISGPAATSKADQRNVCIFAERQVDRSPTGTGTAGRLAQLYAKGLWPDDRPLRNESIIGTHFTGKVLGTTKVGEFEAIIPEVSGQAYITGFCQWLVDPDDPVAEGFFVR